MSVYHDLLQKYPELLGNDQAMIQIIHNQQTIQEWQLERAAALMREGKPASWADIGIVFEDPYFFIVRDLVQFPNGRMNGYCRVLSHANLSGGKGVVVLPEYQGRIMLLHQYRHPTRQWHYEIPRGYGEAHIPPVDNARKEVLEETGGEIAELVELGEMYNNTGFEGGSVSLFYARLASIGQPNEDEGIASFIWLDVAGFEQWIADGRVNDGFTIAAYSRAKLRGLL